MNRKLGVLVAVLLVASTAANGAIVITRESSPSTAVVDAAEAEYGKSIVVRPATDAAFGDAFPSYDLYVVAEPEKPFGDRHAMAYNPDSGEGFDISSEFDDLLGDKGVLIMTESEAILYAEAFAQTANTELEEVRNVVYASDSDRLNRTIEDPEARQLVDGWEVTLSTWSQPNGVLSDWVLRFGVDTIGKAQWQVRETGTGDAQPNLEKVDLNRSTLVVNDYTSTGHEIDAYWVNSDGDYVDVLLPSEVLSAPVSTFVERTTFDGSTWRGDYVDTPSADPPVTVLEAAEVLAEAGVDVYDRMVTESNQDCTFVTNPDPNWGFTAGDPDCELRIVVASTLSLTCTICNGGREEVRIFAAPGWKETLHAKGYYEDPDHNQMDRLAGVLMAHEFFHHLQVISSTDPTGGDVWREGMARFVQTAYDPLVELDPTSLWYGTQPNPKTSPPNIQQPFIPDGVNDHQLHPDRALCDRSYDYGLFWGFLYEHDGGIDTIRSVLENLADTTGFCENRVPDVVDQALQQASGDHDSFQGALLDFTMAAWLGEFSWGSVDGSNTTEWGTHLLDPFTETLVDGTGTYETEDWGTTYVGIPSFGTYEVDCSTDEPTKFAFRILYVDAFGTPGSDTHRCGYPTTIDTSHYDRVAFNAVRTDASPGEFSVTVS